MKIFPPKTIKIAVIGLGYVGLPLAVAFAKYFSVVGYDINKKRVTELNAGVDRTGEVDIAKLKGDKVPTFTSDALCLEDCNIFIVTVPTPIDQRNKPDLSALKNTSHLIGRFVKNGDVVIFESTVYPGVTEEVCGPIISETSGLNIALSDMGCDPCFYLGYSPERINPGDATRTIDNIVKVTSGSTPDSACFIDELYQTIISAGTHKAESIKIAEAAKVIENTQRDVNIGLVNEFSLIFDKLGIDTQAVLEAAGTKWNFLKFWPGLVGGHCIGVDPYYLTHKAIEIGYNPEIILAGRRLNDSMSQHAARKLKGLMLEHDIDLNGSRILVLGLTFKENCPDTRNSKIFDLINSLSRSFCDVDVYDPLVVEDETVKTSGVNLISSPSENSYDAILLAVPHAEFLDAGLSRIRSYGRSKHVLFDLKYAFTKEQTDGRL